MIAIFAVNAVDSFGDGKTMPWPHSTVDLKRFKEFTSGHTVLMGSKTWNSDMPKPLPNRRNCVLSTKLVDNRCEVFSNVQEFMMATPAKEKIFVIGGANVLLSTRYFINEIYLTRFKSTEESTVKIDVKKYIKDFNLVSSDDFGDHTFEIYKRIL